MDDATLRAAAGKPPPAEETETPNPDEVLRAAVARTDRRARKVTTGHTGPRPTSDLHHELHKAGAYITDDDEIVVGR